MSLHELYRMAKGKLDSKEMNTTCSVDQSSVQENNFFELVWENGQISMLGQSSRARKIPTCKSLPSHCLPSHSPKIQDKDVGYANATNIRMVKFGDFDTSLNEIRMPDEEVIPWLNYGMDDESLEHDYSSDFLHEFSGVTMKELSPSNNFSLLDKRSTNCNQVFKDSHKQGIISKGLSNNTSNATQHAPCGETTQMEKQDPIMSSNSSTIMNFSHFARSAAIVKANLQNIDMGNKSKVATAATRTNPPESTKVVEPSKVDLKQMEPKSLQQNGAVSTQFDPTCKENVSKIDHTSNLVLGESSGIKEQEDVEKRMEPAVASSSVCSGNGAERCSDESNQILKRKIGDTEDSEYQSEDVEEESVGVKKVASVRGAMGSKRSRSAEVHNLSERRRRDRINEKMRALQELIPNCNKVDKASMLDEAIEYLKTLQHQVQIMSMGAGLYMPTMMVPAGMQHMHAPHMAPFSPMGVGMQMGLGIGCGLRMPEINSGSSRFPMVQVPQMQGTHFPAANISGSSALHGMARSNPQVFGIPSQGIPMAMPHGPLFPFQGEPLMNSSSLGLNSCATTGLMETVDSGLASSLKNPMPNVSSQVMQNTNGSNSACQMPNQCEATTGGFEHSALVHNSGHASEAMI